jgi:NADPH:quinone reductase
MRAIGVNEFGGPDVLTLLDQPVPSSSEGTVVVKTHAAGVNFIDTYQREGKYPGDFPLVPGFEGAGVVSGAHPDEEVFTPGTRVAWAMATHSYAEYVAIPVKALTPVPDDIDLDTAAASMLQGLTAHYLTTDVYPVTSETVALVHAGAGGTGQILTQVLRSLGATVITTVSSADKEAISLAAGAHHVIRYDRDDFVEKALELTDGRGVDVIYDGVGSTTVVPGLKALVRRGMMVYFGAASGSVKDFDLQMLSSLGSLVITKPTLSDFVASHEEVLRRSAALFDWLKTGAVTVTIGGRYPLSEAASAHLDLEGRTLVGKAILTMD